MVRSLHDMYPVVQDARLVGCISSKQIAGIPQGQWKQVTVRDLATPCTEENTLNANANALDALSRMSRTGHTRLMVVEGDRLVGIVTLKDLLKLITLRLNLEDAA